MKLLHQLIGWLDSGVATTTAAPRTNSGFRIRSRVPVPQCTGPLTALEGRVLLVVADIENVTISARRAGCRIDFKALADRLASVATLIELRAVFSSNAGDTRLADALTAAGWTPYSRPIEHVATPHGIEKTANADNLFAFHAGQLTALFPGDVLCVTGDGALGLDCGLSIAQTAGDRARRVSFLAFPGTLSARLRDPQNQNIASCLDIGADVLRPITSGS
jgi:hypothetical protein